MQPLGLKISDATDKERLLREFKIEKGNSLGLFKVIQRTENEVLIGEDDKHLNFRISFLPNKRSTNSYTFILSTTVLIK
jgi:hypothetical protein